MLSALASLVLASVPSSGCESFQISLSQPDVAPTETVVITIASPVDMLGWVLLDYVPGPVVLSPTLTLDVGLSPFVLIYRVDITAANPLVVEHTAVCGRTFFDTPLLIQAVSFDPVAMQLCASNLVSLIGVEQGFCDPCVPCDGGVSEMTARYLGDQPALIEVTRAGKPNELLFSGIVDPQTTFAVLNAGKAFPSQIDVLVDGVVEQTLKTNCETSIAPGIEFGSFRILSVTSKNGGLVCPLDQSELDCDDGKAARLTMRYTGGDCASSDNDQAAGSWSCSGGLSGNDPVRVVATTNFGDVYFDGIVSVGDTFVVDSADAGHKNDLQANTKFYAYDLNGTLLQSVTVHTSCSQPFGAGDSFGAFEILEFVPSLQ